MSGRLYLVKNPTEPSCQLLKFPRITDLSLSWSIWAKRLKKESAHVTSSKVLICVFGKATALTIFTIKTVHKNLYTPILRNPLFNLYWKDTMQLFWLTARLEQEKLIQWRVLNTMGQILSAVLYLAAWKKYSSLFKCRRITK